MLLIADKLDILFILPAPGNIGEVLNDCPTLHLHLTFTPWLLYLCACCSMPCFPYELCVSRTMTKRK